MEVVAGPSLSVFGDGVSKGGEVVIVDFMGSSCLEQDGYPRWRDKYRRVVWVRIGRLWRWDRFLGSMIEGMSLSMKACSGPFLGQWTPVLVRIGDRYRRRLSWQRLSSESTKLASRACLPIARSRSVAYWGPS